MTNHRSLARDGYTDEQILAALRGTYGTRRLEFRYELLSATNTLVKGLDNVLSGDVNYDGLADVKRTARFRLLDDGSVDYLIQRIKPWIRLHMPTLPVAGSIQAATTYEEAITNGVRYPLARWRFDELTGATIGADSVADNDLTIGATATPGEQPLIEDVGRSLGLVGGATSRGYLANAAFLSGLTAVSFAGWFRSTTIGQAADLITTTSGLTWGDRLPLTWDGYGTGTWSQAVVETWDSLRSEDWDTLGPWGGLTAETGGLFVRFNAATKAIDVTFYAGDAKVTGSTPANTQTTERTFLAFTWTSGGTLKVYLNGEPVITVDSANVVGGLQGIGALVVGGIGFVGQVDYFLWAGSQISDSAVRDLYITGAAIGPAAPPERRYVEFPQGVFLLASPARSLDDQGVVTRDVEAYDQGVVLQTYLADQPYYVAAGALVTDAITEILATTPGIVSYSVVKSTKTIPALRVWDAGTAHLKIVNELTSSINYEALWFDEDGTAIAAPYVAPQDRPVGYHYEADEVSVLMPGASQSLDLYKQPNKWVLVVSQPNRPPLVATYTNTDPASPTSTVRRGRTITDFRTETDVTDQAVLNAKAIQLGQEAAEVYEQLEFGTAIMPMHGHRDVLFLGYPELGIAAEVSETKWSYSLAPGAEMKHTARRVVVLAGSLT